MDDKETIKVLMEQNQRLVDTLQGIINSCAHPAIALRCVMVDLKPIRAALKRNEETIKNLTHEQQ